MLEHLFEDNWNMEHLSGDSVIIANGSPRMRDIIPDPQQRISFRGNCLHVLPSTAVENLNKNDVKYAGENVWKYAVDTARLKANEIFCRIIHSQTSTENSEFCATCLQDEFMVIGTHIIVTYDNKIYQDPEDEGDAKQILKELSGKTHSIIYAVVIISSNGKLDITGTSKSKTETYFHTSTDVEFDTLADTILEEHASMVYSANKRTPYGIQGIGFDEYSFIEHYMEIIKKL